VFVETDLLNAAGPRVFDRALDYARYVAGLQVRKDEAVASIQARRVYAVRLTWSGSFIDGECSCPHSRGGHFCKHLVAVGLAVLDAGGGALPGNREEPAIWDYLDGLDAAALRRLVVELIDGDESAFRLVQSRAVGVGLTAAVDSDELARTVSAMMPRGFVDYRRSFDAARDVQALLDDLEALLDAGAADQVRPALERATTRLRKILLKADDSAGVLGDAVQRAAELHARACVAGEPDPAKLARWLVKFRKESPGWPHVTLSMYAAAFDRKALAVYRDEVARWDTELAEAEWSGRLELDRVLLELADHDGDVHKALELLSRDPEHTAYGAIIARLGKAGRSDEVCTWVDRAVAAGRISSYSTESNDYWLVPKHAAELYRAAGRCDDALAVLRDSFARQPSPEMLRTLLGLADALGRVEVEHAWALRVAEQIAERSGDGAPLIRIALSDGDLVAAWAACQRFGAGGAWRELAEASADDFPFDAAQLYRAESERLLAYPNTRLYPEVARLLVTMRALYARVGEEDAFAAVLADVRDRYKRRTSLLAALDRAGLRTVPETPGA
jgi:hypothetical protein